ncbi:hypothetical protein TD95_004961 [Thielaviopsis punctulata]|uniref:Uncharacterized protein n=1 Tax=Thielaviopsis punctulata TaxID=72032 RepID=A0A0F4ZCH6_9PEZI|nr:hypothetical protein TD95_004961 [Thielaviopsis punctulata]
MSRSRDSPLFSVLWQDPDIRERLFYFLSKADISSVRLVNIACSGAVTRRLFKRTQVTFRPISFTKASRIRALCRIGKYIEHLTFSFPHSSATFLPPVIHPQTGQEISFIYTPHTSTLACVSRPKYTSAELADILLQQYPPLFHAATNVSTFVTALGLLVNLRHITISCPGQEPQERYRRSVVDYALISLRIALEKAPLKKLHKMSLSRMHAAAFVYLRHLPGFGSSPAAARRWQQIKTLHITVDSWDFSRSPSGMDHLRMLQDYLRSFSTTLEKLSFSWTGDFKGPCPLYLSADPQFLASSSSLSSSLEGKRLSKEVTSPMSPLPPLPASDTNGLLKMPKLRYMEIRNTIMSSAQIRSIIDYHKKTVRDFDFGSVILSNKDSWEEAIQPLRCSSDSNNSYWSERSILAMGEPINMFGGIMRDDKRYAPSAAVQAAAQQLLRDTLDNPKSCNYQNNDVKNVFTARLAKKKTVAQPKTHKRRERESQKRGKEASSRPICAPASPALSTRSKEKKFSGTDSLFSEMVDVSKPRPLRLPGSSKSSRMPISPPRTPEDHSVTPATLGAISPQQRTTPPHTPPTSPKAALKAALRSPPRLRSPLSRTTSSTPPFPSTPPQTPLTPHLDVSPVQRNLAQEEAHRRLAQDPALRTATLQRAREAVLQNMARSYNNHHEQNPEMSSRHGEVSSDCYCTHGYTTGTAVRRELFEEIRATVSVVSDGGLVESQTALVPLILLQ